MKTDIACVLLPERSSPSRTINAPRLDILLPRVDPESFKAQGIFQFFKKIKNSTMPICDKSKPFCVCLFLCLSMRKRETKSSRIVHYFCVRVCGQEKRNSLDSSECLVCPCVDPILRQIFYPMFQISVTCGGLIFLFLQIFAVEQGNLASRKQNQLMNSGLLPKTIGVCPWPAFVRGQRTTICFSFITWPDVYF
jgi:hypothetical protein